MAIQYIELRVKHDDKPDEVWQVQAVAGSFIMQTIDALRCKRPDAPPVVRKHQPFEYTP